MADLLQWSSDWLQKQRRKHLTRPVTYSRGSAAVQVRCAIGRERFEIIGDFGIVEKDEHRSYLIMADDLVLPGVGKTTPERGDQIRERQDGVIYVYEVMAPGNNDHHWKWVDKYRKMLGVHAKLVSTE
jgi:hypothetical protein